MINHRQKVMYVSGPYTAVAIEETEENIKKAEALSLLLIAAGWAVITPHKNYAFYSSVDYDTIMRICLELLRRSDAMICLPRWQQSNGTLMEIDFATVQRIPIFKPSENSDKFYLSTSKNKTKYCIIPLPHMVDFRVGK